MLTAFSLKAEDEPLSQEDGLTTLAYRDFNKIEILDKTLTRVFLLGDASGKIGLDSKELTDYLSIRIKNNFANIKFEDNPLGKYKTDQIGYIWVRVWIVGDKYPVACHVKCTFSNGRLSDKNSEMWSTEQMGVDAEDTVQDSIKKSIDEMIQKLSIDFFKARGES